MVTTSKRLLCVNLGSRTAKLAVLAVDADAQLGHPLAAEVERETELADIERPEAYGDIDLAQIDVVAYRVVRIATLPAADAIPFDADARAAIAASAELAPLHTKSVLRAADALQHLAPRARHVAVFDAAFHRTLDAAAATYALPYEDALVWRKAGFHGLSYAYGTARARVLLGAERTRKIVALHLGGGCSACAIRDGRSVETTMGFTPTDGLVMATRSGSLDVGLLLAYMRAKQLSIDDAETLVAQRSGLLGLGGHADMREIRRAIEADDARAKLAYDVFVHRTIAAVGAMSAALGGLDALLFLGGIGEHDARVRADVCAAFDYLGVALDATANAAPAGDAVISAETSRVAVLRIGTREDWTMALAAAAA